MASKAEKLARKIFGSNLIKQPGPGGKLQKKYKVVVFVPLEKTDELTFALSAAGAGNIGNYSVCSFRTTGVGTFMGNESSAPATGAKGKFEMADEIRLEMICSKKSIEGVIDTIFKIHPYDEPAYEIYEVLTKEKPRGEIYTFGLKKSIQAKEVFRKISPQIDFGMIKPGLKKIRVTGGTIDCSGRELKAEPDIPAGSVYITKNKKIIKAYIN